ncbi:uncharacterized protein LOC106068325 [Biomphalaria glabrata]|uniref:Uncharacterized protein LOC106068325 n=1 Tax=Biomphalaria glabrata TaxID=6526 RepID=A0A9W2ZCK8_BIOGL|nr:uncharacterized protein LOC106068325 [Biomphalaria glabrata]
MGRTFLVALPGVKDMSIHCFLSTLTSIVEVHAHTHHLKNMPTYHIVSTTVQRFRGCYVAIESHNVNTTGIDISFSFRGNGSFGLMIMVTVKKDIFLDAMQALPEESWGLQYFVASTDNLPTIHVVSCSENNLIKFQFKEPRPELFEQYPWYSTKANSKGISVALDHWQTFTISACGNISRKVMSLSGTVVKSYLPIGVIVGTCYVSYNDCANQGNYSQLALEMLMPAQTYGYCFIPVALNPVHSDVRLQAVTLYDRTTIWYTSFENVKVRQRVDHSDTAIYFRYKAISLVNANRAIQLVYMMESMCTECEMNMTVTLCMVVPIELFYDVYAWRVPRTDHKVLSMDYFAALVILQKRLKFLKLNEAILILPSTASYSLVSNSSVRDADKWLVLILQLHAEDYSVYDVGVVRFGCYLYGRGHRSAFNIPAGYISSNIQECLRSAPKHGDLYDNDCDGIIDEEVKDGRDNDIDGFVDEDLIKLERVNGGWGSWSEWTCSRNCYDFRKFRTRECDNPSPNYDGLDCGNASIESKDSNCYTTTTCPSLCPQGAWAYDCVRSCVHCLPDCDKFTGICSQCQPGYKDPHNSCPYACDVNTYGSNCSGNCLQKCGADCFDRVTGACRDDSWDWINYLLIIPFLVVLVMVICTYRAFCVKAQKNTKSPPNAARIELTSSSEPPTDAGSRFQSMASVSSSASASSRGSSCAAALLQKSTFSFRARIKSSTSIDTGTHLHGVVHNRAAPPGILVKKVSSADSESEFPRLKKTVSFAGYESGHRPNFPEEILT